MTKPWMIYGVNGYTGMLCAEVAAARGEKPVVAGRREDAVRAIADRFGWEYRVFSLDDPERVKASLEGVHAVLLAAGPFAETAQPMMQACLDMRVHYLDITGEIAIFESARKRDEEARQAGIVLLPGVGFDVVPSDCLANSLSRALPDADSLELAFAGSAVSKGTAKTALSRMHEGGVVRRHGELVPMAAGELSQVVRFRDKARLTMNIPWGDIATAHQSTGIPNITVYTAVSRNFLRATSVINRIGPVIKARPVQWLGAKAIERFISGPSHEERVRTRSQFWGRVSRGSESVTATLTTPEGYTLTALTSVDATVRTASGEVRPGSLTPAMAFGPDYITTFADCTLELHAGLANHEAASAS